MFDTRFKSYYVVWKLVFNMVCGADERGSLNRTMQYGNPSGKVRKLLGQASLNRTMQYGNGCMVQQLLKELMTFKSYYVVWKHVYFSASSQKNRQSLNRTMQYGNWFIELNIIDGTTRFKSYYVVWKLFHKIPSEIYAHQFKSYYVVWKHKIIKII